MNAPITDPWYSRPIDVHRWSEHPEAIQFKDRLWETYFSDFDQPERPGPKPKTSFRQQFGVLLLDLFVAWKTDPELSIGVPNVIKRLEHELPIQRASALQEDHSIGRAGTRGGAD